MSIISLTFNPFFETEFLRFNFHFSFLPQTLYSTLRMAFHKTFSHSYCSCISEEWASIYANMIIYRPSIYANIIIYLPKNTHFNNYSQVGINRLQTKRESHQLNNTPVQQ